MTSPQPKVCVIGAGIAGIAAAKVLSEDSFDVTVFEKEQGLGGVWRLTSVAYSTRTALLTAEQPIRYTAATQSVVSLYYLPPSSK